MGKLDNDFKIRRLEVLTTVCRQYDVLKELVKIKDIFCFMSNHILDKSTQADIYTTA